MRRLFTTALPFALAMGMSAARAEDTPAKPTTEKATQAASDTAKATSDTSKKAADAASDTTAKARDAARDTRAAGREAARDTRTSGREQAREAREETRDARSDGRDRAQDARGEARDRAQDARRAGQDAIRSGRRAARDTAEDARDTARSTREGARDAARDTERRTRDGQQEVRRFSYDRDANRRERQRSDNDDANALRRDRDRDRDADRNANRNDRDEDQQEARSSDRRRDVDRRAETRRDRDRADSNYMRRDRRHRELDASQLGFSVSDDDSDEHLTIRQVERNGIARRIGFRDGDQIVSINRRNVSGWNDFVRWVTPDTRNRVTIIVLRDGNERTLYLEPTVIREIFIDSSSSGSQAYLGVVLDQQYRNDAVVTRVNRNSPADHSGLRTGDVILAVDGERVRSPYDVSDIVAQMSPGNEVTLDVDRDGEEMELSATLGSR